jgi:hypothetical protein
MHSRASSPSDKSLGYSQSSRWDEPSERLAGIAESSDALPSGLRAGKEIGGVHFLRSSQTIMAMAPTGMAITTPITSSSAGAGSLANGMLGRPLYRLPLFDRKSARLGSLTIGFLRLNLPVCNCRDGGDDDA